MDIGDRIQKPCEEQKYISCVRWCKTHEATIADRGDYYEIVALKLDADREALEHEMNEKQIWLNQHDYIGTKIATGRATISDYSSEIQTMREYAQRIDEIRAILGGNT